MPLLQNFECEDEGDIIIHKNYDTLYGDYGDQRLLEREKMQQFFKNPAEFIKQLPDLYYQHKMNGERISVQQAVCNLFGMTWEQSIRELEDKLSQNNEFGQFYIMRSNMETFQPFNLRACYTCMDFFAHLYQYDSLSDAGVKCGIKNQFIRYVKKLYLPITLKNILDDLESVDFSQSVSAVQESLLLSCFQEFFDYVTDCSDYQQEAWETEIKDSPEFRKQLGIVAEQISFLSPDLFEQEKIVLDLRRQQLHQRLYDFQQLIQSAQIVELQENWDIQVSKYKTDLTQIQAYYVGIGPESHQLSKLSKLLSRESITDALRKVRVSERSTDELCVLVTGDSFVEPALPSTDKEVLERLRFVLVMERNSPDSDQYTLQSYVVGYRQSKDQYLLRRKVNLREG